MNKYTTLFNKNQTWSVLRRSDTYGTGYIVQPAETISVAIGEGWEFIAGNMDMETACRVRDIYKTAGAPPMPCETIENPSLDDLLVYDMTEAPEDRDGQAIEEFDLVNIVIDGFWLEGTVTAIEEDYVEIDGVWTVDRIGYQCELIAKAEDDCGFIEEYGQWLDHLEENYERLYEAAVSAQTSTLAA